MALTWGHNGKNDVMPATAGIQNPGFRLAPE
jgi:hypothetical protein